MSKSTSIKDIKKLSQAYLRDKGFYSGAIDGIWGKLSKKAFTRYMDHLQSLGQEIGGDQLFAEDAVTDAVSGVVVIDPGHGGSRKTGGSSPNNSTSASGVKEKKMTLDLAKRLEKQLKNLNEGIAGSDIKVHLTRKSDINLSLSDRAQVAKEKRADIFISIHFNGFNGMVRGSETLIQSEVNGNVNEQEDRELAQRVQSAIFAAIRQFDSSARDRGVKDNRNLGVLNDISLGNNRDEYNTRACLIEVEFIDNPAVDELLNTGPNANVVRDSIAGAIAEAIVEDLRMKT